MLLLLALGVPAHAHYPHAVFEWVAVTTDGRLAAEFARMTAHTLSISDDQLEFESLFLGPGRLEYLDGTWLSEDRIAATTTGEGLWISEDGGASWAPAADIPADAELRLVASSPAIAVDGTALATSTHDDGGGAVDTIWMTLDAGESWQPAWSAASVGEWKDLVYSHEWDADGRACALPAAGGPLCTDDHGDTWQALPLPAGWTAAASVGLDGDGGVWLARATGLARSVNGGVTWVPLSTPADADLVHVRPLADGVVLITDDNDAWRSADGGQSWTLATGGIEPREDGTGGPPDGLHYRDVELAPDGTVYLAMWEGVYRGGSTGDWQALHTMPVTQIRAISAAPRGPGGAWVQMGSEGTGSTLADSTGSVNWAMGVFGDGAEGLPLHIRDVTLAHDYEESGDAFTVSQWGVALTRDWGQSWTPISSATSPIEMALGGDLDEEAVLTVGGSMTGYEFQYLPAGEELLAVGRANPPCSDGVVAVGDIPPWEGSLDRVLASCSPDGTIYASIDRGATWVGRGRADTASVVGTVLLPDGETIWIATADGLMRLVEGEDEAAVFAFPGELVQSVALSPAFAEDGAAFAVLARGAWFRTEDGGESWQELDTPTRQLPWQVAVPADFADSGVVVVGGMDGAWASHDRGETWQWITTLIRLEEHGGSSQVQYEPDDAWPVQTRAGASGGWVRGANQVGAQVIVDFEGLAAQLWMPTGPTAGVVSLQLDDEPAVELDLHSAETPSAAVWERDDLAAGWHRLVITIESGSAMFDALYTWQQLPDETGPLPWELSGGDGGADDTGDGGAGDGGASDGGAGDGGTGDGGTSDGGASDGGAEDPGGCGCQGAPAAPALAWAVLPLLVAARRRSRVSARG